jgi:hypothetical protein
VTVKASPISAARTADEAKRELEREGYNVVALWVLELAAALVKAAAEQRGIIATAAYQGDADADRDEVRYAEPML